MLEHTADKIIDPTIPPPKNARAAASRALHCLLEAQIPHEDGDEKTAADWYTAMRWSCEPWVLTRTRWYEILANELPMSDLIYDDEENEHWVGSLINDIQHAMETS